MQRSIAFLMCFLVTMVSCQEATSPIETKANPEQKSVPLPEPIAAKEPMEDESIRRLIQTLASRDEAPPLVRGGGLGGGFMGNPPSGVSIITPQFSGGGQRIARFPEGFDHSHEEKVRKTSEQLASYGKQAIPHLIASRDDSRYCRTVRWAEDSNESVGQVCMGIVGRIVEDFPSRSGYKGAPSYLWQGIKRNPEQWWEEHKHMTLREIQIEALTWTIEAEQQREESYIKLLWGDRATMEKTIIEPLKQDLAKLRSEPAKH